MLEIKSSFILKIILSNINEKSKLNIIRFNKTLQNKLDINIMNYIIFGRKYFIGDKNGKGKEYFINYTIIFANWMCYDKLIFEGEYLNGKRNGKGKEYELGAFEGTVSFEGEYKNGKRNGKGIGEQFKGEYKDGKRWNGIVTEDISGDELYKIKNGNLLIEKFNKFDGYFFEGEYINGQRNGKGKTYQHHNWEDKYIVEFEGEYLNGNEHGKGKEYNNYGNLIFEGEYFYGKRWNGKGYIGRDKNEIAYELKDGKGYIKEYNCGTLKFEGEYLYGTINGKGKEYNYDGKLIFEGEYLNGNKHGKGKEYNKNGDLIFEGEYLYGYRRKGKLYIEKKLEFDGEYLIDGKWDGKGYDQNGNVIYELHNGNGMVKEYDCLEDLVFEGEYNKGKRNGKGKEYKYGQLCYEGEYNKGKRNGKGKEYKNGQLCYMGEYNNGERNEKRKEYLNGQKKKKICFII